MEVKVNNTTLSAELQETGEYFIYWENSNQIYFFGALKSIDEVNDLFRVWHKLDINR